MENDAASQWRDHTAQQLVCYEALFKLLDQIQPLEDVEKIAKQVAKQWKYFANVACWRLVVQKDDVFQVIDGFQGTAAITETAILSPWDSHHLATRLPYHILLAESVKGPDPPDHLMNGSIVEIQVLPFVRLGQCIGVLSVASRHEAFSELDKKFIRLFGSHLADRIFDLLLRKRSMATLVNKATHDDLTGLYNRGSIMERLSMLLELSSRTNEPMSIILADIDHFKNINDTHGHLVGDEVLREVSRRLQQQTRQADHLGRYGGEEFLFVLYPCNNEQVKIAAERFRKVIGDIPITIDENNPRSIMVTISLGCSTIHTGDHRADGILQRADDALYQSKASGRNRTTIN